MYYPNHKYDFASEDLTTKPEHENKFQINFSNLSDLNPSANDSSQLGSPLSEDSSADSAVSETLASERKLTVPDGHHYLKSSPTKVRRIYENFVTPKVGGSKKNYEVTTRKLVDTAPEDAVRPSALGVDNDVAIALDDEDVDDEAQPETSRPGKVYLDSYGRLHGGVSHRGHGYGYGVVHLNTPSHHLTTGRVRIQVFRGPTRYVGHKKFAPWGYFVVQPADNGGPHRYPGPPYGYY